jgi:hypothetical protein
MITSLLEFLQFFTGFKISMEFFKLPNISTV